MKRTLGIAMVLGLIGLPVMAQEVKTEKVHVVDLGKDVKLETMLIPVGKFMMGSPKSEKDRLEKEAQHEVTISKSFYIGKYEVTQDQWEAVMGDNPSVLKGGKLPVTNVSWDDCQKFIKNLNAKTNGGYRLPTESEWEYACRAGTRTVFSVGDKITPEDANYGDSKIGKPVAVGSYKPNDFGLYDMHGNVWEWCNDRFGDYPTKSLYDPSGPSFGPYRILRGGAFYSFPSLFKSASRFYDLPIKRDDSYGLRLAKDS